MVPVTDVDRAKEFYEKVGFIVDHDHMVSDDVRFVQLTPPGSACSIAIGKGLTQMEPGSLDNLQMVVADADAARAELARARRRGQRGRRASLGSVRLLRRPRRQRLGAPGAARLVEGRRRRGLSPAAGSPGASLLATPVQQLGNETQVDRPDEPAGRSPSTCGLLLERQSPLDPTLYPGWEPSLLSGCAWAERSRVGPACRSGVDGGAARGLPPPAGDERPLSPRACAASPTPPALRRQSLAPRPPSARPRVAAASTMLVASSRAERTSASASPWAAATILRRLGPGVGAPLIGVAGSHLQQPCGRGRTLPRHHDLP